MAGDVAPPEGTAPAAPVKASDEPLIQPQPQPQPTLPYPMRFRLAYFALAIVLGAAVGGFVLFLGWPESKEQPFSTWQPTKEGEARAYEIADHVTARYKHPSGNRLVSVELAGPPIAQFPGVDGTVQETPIRALIIRGRTRDFSDADVFQLSGENSVMYSLCGGGENCMMDEGTPGRARGRLLGREVLELALYSYHYLEGVNNVIALLPPIQVTAENGQTANMQRLVFLRRRDLARHLRAPVERTLPGSPQVGMSAVEAATVDGTINPNLYEYSLQRAGTGDPVLVARALAA